jgi:hypothetical protein
MGQRLRRAIRQLPQPLVQHGDKGTKVFVEDLGSPKLRIALQINFGF